MSNPLRIGILGGTFDPIHNVHIDIARAALAFADLDKVLFVVAARPPHKQDEFVASPEDRFALVQAALADEPKMEASRLELDRIGPSYTVVTLQRLLEQYPGAELYLIVGMDSLADLPQWKDAAGILARARILAVPRPGPYTIPGELEGRYTLLPFPEAPESSTDLRRLLAEGEPLEGRVPTPAASLIHEHKLYHGNPGRAARE